MNWLRSIFHILTIIGVLMALHEMTSVLEIQESAIQQTAVIATAIAYVVIPYCFARAVEQLTGR